MSLSVISSNAPVVPEVAPQKGVATKATSEPVAAAPAADTVNISPTAQKLQSADVDHDGDSH